MRGMRWPPSRPPGGPVRDPDEIETGLSGYEPIGQRMQFLTLPNGCVLIDDTYNANPGSMMAAV